MDNPENKEGLKSLGLFQESYRPVTLHVDTGFDFEKIIYNSLYEYLKTNKILNKSQSGFLPGDSCILQLLEITHLIYKSFDSNLETRGIFLDMSKAFDKVWHNGLLFKLKTYGVEGQVLKLFTNYLSSFLFTQTSC